MATTITESQLVTILANAKRGSFVGVTARYDDALKSNFYAKNQTDKTDKNPFWGANVSAEKHYVINIGAYYENALAKVGGTPTDNDDTPYKSVVNDLVFAHKVSGELYLQIIGNAKKSTYYLNGKEMTDAELATLNKYKKPYNPKQGVVNDYKKIKFSRLVEVTIDKVTYRLSNAPLLQAV